MDMRPYQRQPYLFLGFSATFLGLMQAAYDFIIAYLTGQGTGEPLFSKRRDSTSHLNLWEQAVTEFPAHR